VDLVGKIVEVVTSETTYRGRLIELNSEEIYLESESGWIVVPVDSVALMREVEEE
jgi:hypothetical protein